MTLTLCRFSLALLRLTGLACCLGACGTVGGPADGTGSTSFVLPLTNSGISAPGKPVEVYVRLARLAKQCWFLSPAPLQQGYVFAADVSPEARGGTASISIFEHNAVTETGIAGQRGLKAYGISLTPDGDKTAIGIENGRLPETFDRSMRADIGRWAAGETSCGAASTWPAAASTVDESVRKAPPRKK